ncbi:hypothetical protein Pla100_23200 [Neorhodopirellula pilleata]|uniref:Uncharacterized protein n=1 Tax=Neorhodopirellula pilleata TaxID=2714738 RepID=A0A5C6ADM9_9BACT|nr:hypothetical protein Pla100_23200 [Neorhodopirellula pilleata]
MWRALILARSQRMVQKVWGFHPSRSALCKNCIHTKPKAVWMGLLQRFVEVDPSIERRSLD